MDGSIKAKQLQWRWGKGEPDQLFECIGEYAPTRSSVTDVQAARRNNRWGFEHKHFGSFLQTCGGENAKGANTRGANAKKAATVETRTNHSPRVEQSIRRNGDLCQSLIKAKRPCRWRIQVRRPALAGLLDHVRIKNSLRRSDFRYAKFGVLQMSNILKKRRGWTGGLVV
jgi:hypothetical protein